MNKNLPKAVSGSSILRMFIVLLFSVGVAIASIEIITYSATKKLTEQADRISQLRCRTVRKTISAVLVGTEWVGDSFLANMSHITYTEGEGDVYHAYHVIDNDQLKNLHTEKLYTRLKLFLESNYDLYSASFIFKPGVIADAPARGIAANVLCSDFSERDLLDDYDIFSRNIFLDAETKKVTYISKSGPVSEAKMPVITFVFPLFNESGELLGEFWADAKLEALSEVISKALPSDELTAIILDNDLHSVASNIPEWNAKDFADIMEELTGETYSVENTLETEQLVKNREKITFDSEINGEEYKIMFSPMEGYEYTILLSIPTNIFGKEISAFKKFMLLVSMIGILLLLGSLFYAFIAFKKKVEENLKMNSDLAIAADIQRNFLPRANFKNDVIDFAAFQRPAKKVGGDLFDYIERDGKLFFCIGDVSGKGVPASIFMGLASSHFRNACRYMDKVEDIAASINNSLADRNESSVFCTMFLGVLDMNTLEMAYCNAGHEGPALLSEGGKTEFLETVGDIPLGIEDGYRFSAGTVTFKKGQRLFFFTDGISEARAADRKLFRKEHILQTLAETSNEESSSQTIKHMIAKVEHFAKGAEQSDDITMISISFI